MPNVEAGIPEIPHHLLDNLTAVLETVVQKKEVDVGVRAHLSAAVAPNGDQSEMASALHEIVRKLPTKQSIDAVGDAVDDPSRILPPVEALPSHLVDAGNLVLDRENPGSHGVRCRGGVNVDPRPNPIEMRQTAR